MPSVLIYGDTVRSPELRHEVPVPIGDPFVYLEHNGTRRVFVGSLEIPRLVGLDGLDVRPLEELGLDELYGMGLRSHELHNELLLRACRIEGVGDALVPREFPLGAADHLRGNDVQVRPDAEFFDRRRRAKSAAELAGIRRAQSACERAMDSIRERLREGGATSSEELKARVLQTFNEAGMLAADEPIVSHGAQTAIGHDAGSGEIAAGEPIVVDLYPQDPESGCYADMTRTFCVGEPPEELAGYHRLCRQALDRVYEAVRPGVSGAELHRIACDLFEQHGHPTQLSKQPGQVLEDGFFHSLGHGVGLEVHEEPYLGRNGDVLVPGDVLAIEPGLYRKGFGGCRLEDLVLVTDDGCEVLANYPYDLAP